VSSSSVFILLVNSPTRGSGYDATAGRDSQITRRRLPRQSEYPALLSDEGECASRQLESQIVVNGAEEALLVCTAAGTPERRREGLACDHCDLDGVRANATAAELMPPAVQNRQRFAGQPPDRGKREAIEPQPSAAAKPRTDLLNPTGATGRPAPAARERSRRESSREQGCVRIRLGAIGPLRRVSSYAALDLPPALRNNVPPQLGQSLSVDAALFSSWVAPHLEHT
jgi:hypothetical protein